MAGMAGGGPVKAEPGNMGPMQRRAPQQEPPSLATFIYDFFLKKKAYGAARAMIQSEEIRAEMSLGKRVKGGPDMNGADMDSDAKEDLPPPLFFSDSMNNPQGDPFLAEWWNIFWDVWNAARTRSSQPPVLGYFNQYFQHSQGMRANRQQVAQNSFDRGMNPTNSVATMRNAMGQIGNPGDVRRQAMAGNAQRNPSMMGMRPGQPGGPMGPQQMQRDGSQVDMSGQDRAPSPMSGGDTNAPSPKRPRIEGGFNGMNQARPGAMMAQMNGAAPNGAPNMMPNGFDGQGQFGMAGAPGQGPQMMFRGNRPGMGENGMKNFANPNGMPNSPMIPDGSMADGAAFMGPNAAGQMRQAPNGAAVPQQGGALADYQMQLMLLEQQNKKRLLMARQEQDVAHQNGGIGPMNAQGMMNQPPFPGQPGFNGPNGQMSQQPPQAGQPQQQQQLEMARQQSGGRPGNFAPGQVPQMMGNQPQPGVDGQRGQMPPPQAPAGGNNQQRQPPESPAQGANPPTPSQPNKANPKKKGGKDADKSKKSQKKGGTTGATPSSEADPPTPTPQTPITPHPPQSFNNPKGAPGQPPQQQGPNGPSGDMQQQMDAGGNQPFGNIGNAGNMDQGEELNFDAFNMDMTQQEVLEGFDFASFLHMDDQDPMAFDPTQFGGMNGDGVEMGTGGQ